ncbi:MAG: 30S ribosomal protein S20 [Osedax symbiont Rs1]|nr:MAG: 30S ribosomal protein S20 [Osedax symbiont Rs1]
MANSAGSKKRARQAEKRRQHNASFRSMARTYMKKVIAAIEAGDKAVATETFKSAQSVLDASVSKGIFTKNKIARVKSRMNTKIKALA